MNSTEQIGKEPPGKEEEVSLQSYSALDDNIPGGTDPSEGCLVDLTDEWMEAPSIIRSTSKFISTDVGGQAMRHRDVNMWPLEIKMNCITTKGQSLTDVRGQSLANVLPDDFQLEESVCKNAATTSQMNLVTKHQLLVAKTSELAPSESPRCHRGEALHRVSGNSRDTDVCSQDACKPNVPEQLKALSLPRSVFFWQYFYPAPVSWSTEHVQDKGWHESAPRSITWCQSPEKMPDSFAAVDAIAKTETSNFLISKASTSPAPDYLANGYATCAAEVAQKTAAMPCLVSSHSASSLLIDSPIQLGSGACGPQLYRTPGPNVCGTNAQDHEVSRNKRQPSLSENVFRSLSIQSCRKSVQKSAEKRKALLCSTVNVYGHDQPRCYVPPVNQSNIIQPPFNCHVTCPSSVDIREVTCQSSVGDQPMASILSPAQDDSRSNLPIQSPSSSLSHKGPEHECQNLFKCTTCVLAFSRQLALALAFDVMHRRTTTSPLICSNHQDASYDKDAKTFTEKLLMQP